MVEHSEHLSPIVAGFDVFRAREYDCRACHREIEHCYQKKIDEGQSPKTGLEWAVFGCADSRLPVELLFGFRPGQAFVHRNLGNMIPRTPQEDVGTWAAVAYAAKQGIKKFLILGHGSSDHAGCNGADHAGCGAMKATAYGSQDEIVGLWLKQKASFTRLVAGLPDEGGRHNHAARLNVVLGLRRLDRYFDKLAAQNGAQWERPHATGTFFNKDEGNLYLVNRRTAALEPLTNHPLRPDRGLTPTTCPPIMMVPVT